MEFIEDPTIDDLIELYDYYKSNPLIFEKALEENDKKMELIDSYLLGYGEFVEESTNMENSNVSQSI